LSRARALRLARLSTAAALTLATVAAGAAAAAPASHTASDQSLAGKPDDPGNGNGKGNGKGHGKPSPSPSPTETATPQTAFTPGLALKTDKGANTGAAEPSLAVDRHDNVYVSGPVGVPTGGCPVWTIHPGSLNAQGLQYEYDGSSDTDHAGVGGGDCDISTGPNPGGAAGYDDVSVSSLSIANLTTNRSTDGHTFQDPANPVGTQVFGVDRQWQAADYGLGTQGVHYLTVHDLATTNIMVAVSTDGGYSFVSNSTAIDGAHQFAATGNNGNHFGTLVVDPTTHRLYLPFIAPADPNDSVNHVVYVAEGTPDPSNPLLPISWTDHVVYTGPADQTLDHIFPAITIDTAGTVYVAWAGDTASSATNRIALSRMSTPRDASTWTAPVFVDDGTGHSNMFPWLAAGAPGIVDVTWYGSGQAGSGASCPAGQSGQPNDSAGVNNNCFNQFTTKFAQSTDGGQTFAVTDATPVVHAGSICDAGTACLTIGGDRTLLDFFDMELDSAGGANIAYASDIASPGTAQITYTRQCSGVSATTGAAFTRDCGAMVPPTQSGPTETCDGANVITDATGDSSNPTGGPAAGTSDITNVAFTPTATGFDITLTAADLEQVPPTGTADQYWYVTWVGPDGKRYGVEHAEPSALGSYEVGPYDAASNQLTDSTLIDGEFNAGPGGTVVWHVPSAAVGSPTIPVASGQPPAVSAPYAVTVAGEGAADAGGLVFTQPTDRAPDSGTGPAWSVC
jgi:hypothetical protein